VGGPCFAVSCLEGSFDQPQEAVVVDIFSKDVHQEVVIDMLERAHMFIPLSITHIP